MNGYIFSKEAILDLDGIWEFIAEDSVDAADRWIDRLLEAASKIAANPGIGHTRKDLAAPPILFWPVGSYLILYRVPSTMVEIVAVTQGSRDILSLLRHR